MKPSLRNLHSICLTVIVMALSGCIASISNLLTYSGKGQVSIQQPDGETQRLLPDVCRAGELSAFLGFDLASTKGTWQIRALIDPMTGPAVKITGAPGEIVVHKADCSVLNISAYPSGLSVNEINSYDGFVELTCTISTGAHINGRVDVHNCPGGFLNSPAGVATAADLARAH